MVLTRRCLLSSSNCSFSRYVSAFSSIIQTCAPMCDTSNTHTRVQSKNFFGVLEEGDSGDEAAQKAPAVAKKKAPGSHKPPEKER